MTTSPTHLVQRYQPAQRVLHWVGVGSFLVLLASGIVLLPPLGALAAGGLSRLVHRVAAIPFVLVPVAYAVLLPHVARELVRESLSFGVRDREWLARMPAYLLGRTRGLPPQGRLNAGQKLHHASTFLLLLAVSASGVALWSWKGALGPAGLALAATVHDLSTLGLALLMIGHVYFTLLYGALPAMRTGYVSEAYARLEHSDWLAQLAARRAIRTAPAGEPDRPDEGESIPRS